MRSRFLWPLALLLLLPAFISAEVGEDGWCGICTNYFDRAEHSTFHDGAKWCDQCQGFYLGVGSKRHVHVGETPVPEELETQIPDPQTSDPHSTADTGQAAEGKIEKGGDGVSALFRKLPRWAWAVPPGVVVLFFLVPLLRALLRPKKRIVLKPGVLECAPEGGFDGGTSQVYEARFHNGRSWEPAFVKRIVGAGMRSDQRFPMIEFEAGVLHRLESTGVVPRVLVDPETVSLPDGSHWSYYAMSAARGRPWPEEQGGLGDDTHKALAALCEGLMRLHDLDIGHHDLKPQNIFWDARDKRVTLLDFGSAIDHAATPTLVNPLGGTMTGTRPWVPPASDGTVLADLSRLSDNWVYGLLFCQALVGGVHVANHTLRKTPGKPEDRDWFREELGRVCSPAIADAVVDGLFAIDKTRRMKLQVFLGLLRREWEDV